VTEEQWLASGDLDELLRHLPRPAEPATLEKLVLFRGWAGRGGDRLALFRDIFGNPFRPVRLSRAWLAWDGGAVVKLALGIHDEQALDRLPVLADALEEAGCAEAELLGHLRSPGPHSPACWALDLILDKGCWRPPCRPGTWAPRTAEAASLCRALEGPKKAE
jgi:hypothetical protein